MRRVPPRHAIDARVGRPVHQGSKLLAEAGVDVGRGAHDIVALLAVARRHGRVKVGDHDQVVCGRAQHLGTLHLPVVGGGPRRLPVLAALGVFDDEVGGGREGA